MKPKEMDKLIQHFDTYFKQSEPTVLHPIVMEPHIDALVYKPNEAFPYWKMVTMGASDYKMSAPINSLGNRNEYMMFIDPSEDLTDKEVSDWYFKKALLSHSGTAWSGRRKMGMKWSAHFWKCRRSWRM